MLIKFVWHSNVRFDKIKTSSRPVDYDYLEGSAGGVQQLIAINL